MVRRSAVEWWALFEAQARSGMTAAEFCREHGVCPKYFSLRKKALGRGNAVATPSPFVRIEPRMEPAREDTKSRARLRVGRWEWELTGFQVSDLARLMQALA